MNYSLSPSFVPALVGEKRDFFSYSNSPAINTSERRPVACVPEIAPAALVVEVTIGGAGALEPVTVLLESFPATPPVTPPGGVTLFGAFAAAAVKAARVLLELLFLVREVRQGPLGEQVGEQKLTR